jgi:hypothetical protein
LRLEEAIDEIAKDQDLWKNELQPEEWDMLKGVFKFLKSFAIITTYIEATKYPTLSLVVPICTITFWISSKKIRPTKKNIH